MALHRSGQLDAARSCYKKILQRDPKHFDTLHLFGMLCMQVGQPELAVAMLKRAVALNSNVAQLHSILGAALEALGSLDSALASYDKALALQANLAETHYNRASVLRKKGRPEEALKDYDAAIALAPGFAEASYNQGLVLDELERPLEACASYERAITAKADFAAAYFNWGLTLRRLGRLPEALASFDGALAANPEFAQARYSRGLVLHTLNLPEEALAEFDTAVALVPNYAEAYRAKALLLHELQRPEDAIASFDLSLVHCPGDPIALAGRGLSFLLSGRLDEGWRDYEWRLSSPDLTDDMRGGDAPVWRGEPLATRTLYVHSEQGFGDTLQFCRYVPLLGAGASVIFEVQPALKRLLASLPGSARVIARGEPVPTFDLHCSLLSVPGIYATTLETIPAAVPYLAADAAAVALWRERLAGLQGLKVGLTWAGAPRLHRPHAAAIDKRRSVSLDMMAPLSEVTGVTFVSLQKGSPAAQTISPPRGMALVDFTAELNDFADTAALVGALDLVISVDTSVAHLAGAMGKAVWLLNRHDTCWRWLMNRDDSPWYPTLRQFRQSTAGDWSGVMQSARDALAALVRDRSSHD